MDWEFNQRSRSGKMSLSERFYALIPGEKITLLHASFKNSASRKKYKAEVNPPALSVLKNENLGKINDPFFHYSHVTHILSRGERNKPFLKQLHMSSSQGSCCPAFSHHHRIDESTTILQNFHSAAGTNLPTRVRHRAGGVTASRSIAE